MGEVSRSHGAPPLEEEHKQLTPAEKGGLAFQQRETPRGQPSKPQAGSTEEIQYLYADLLLYVYIALDLGGDRG